MESVDKISYPDLPFEESEKPCPKCGSTETDVQFSSVKNSYNWSGDVVISVRSEVEVIESMKITCARCGFVRICKPKDAGLG